MRKIISSFAIISILSFFIPQNVDAAGGIYASGGGAKTVGQTFTITVAASGADFDSLVGKVSVSGPVDIVSFTGLNATWVPGQSPANGKEFAGLISPTSSATIISIKLKGKSVGTGSVSVSGVTLARNGVVTGTGAGGTNFSIERAPELPDQIVVTSSTHPDQNTSYETTSIALTWEKSAKVTAFSYFLDRASDTIPAAKVTSSDTTITYPNQEIGTYYFHIRAKNGDGWGTTTHFKITIKEPDAKIDETLSKPNTIVIEKADNFENDVLEGKVTGILISGITQPNYFANIKLLPEPTLPEGKTFSVQADGTGAFVYVLDFPISAGFYRLTIQGQIEKILTPVSDEIVFEISQAKGGLVSLLTEEDRFVPPPPEPLKWYEKIGLTRDLVFYGFIGLAALLLAIITLIIILKRKSLMKLAKNLKLPTNVQ